MVKKIALSAMAVVAVASQDGNRTNVDDLKDDIATLTKTATETRKNIAYLPHIMSVFENSELKRVGAQNLKDALALVAGVEMSVDSIGMYNPVFRGSNPYAFGQSKLIVDGVEVNDLYFDGYTPYLTMPIELIKRIEVVRGPGAFMTGRSSYAGSIVVTTYQEQTDRQRFDGQVFAGIGDYSEKRGGASYSYKKGDISFYADAYALRDEKKLKYGKDIIDYGVYGTANIPLSQSGYAPMQTDTKALSLFLSDKGLYLKARALSYEHGAGGGISYAFTHEGDQYSLPRYTIETGYKYKIGATTGEIKGGVLEDHFIIEGFTAPAGMVLSGVTYPNGLYAYRKAKLRSYFVENSYKSPVFGGDLSYGIRGKWDTVVDQQTVTTNRATGIGLVDYSTTRPFFDENGFISTVNVYMDYDYDIADNLTANVALYAEKRNRLAGRVEPRFSFIYSLSQEDRLKIFVSKAHRDPSWQEMYTINNQSRIGNPDLKPEVVHSYEMQYLHQFSSFNTFAFDVFYLRNFDQINKLNGNVYQNSGRSNIRGCETEWKGQLDEWTFYLAHTYQWGEDGNGKRLANTANHTVKTHAIYAFDSSRWASAAWRYSGEKAREAGDDRDPMQAYHIVDLSIGQKIKKLNGEMQLSAKNIFNNTVKYPSEPRTYRDDYPAKGRAFYLTFRSSF